MLTCPNCNKQLEDNVEFCDECGAKLNETPSCSECQNQVDADTQSEKTEEATPIVVENEEVQEAEALEALAEQNNEAVEDEKTKKSSKKLLVAGACGLVAVLAVVFLAFLLLNGKKTNYTLYIKDNELFYDNISKGDPLEVTKKFCNGIEDKYDGSMTPVVSRAASFSTLSENGKYLFFPDRLEKNTYSVNLYYRDLTDPDESPKKIDSEVVNYVVNKEATLVIYQTSDMNLYQYDIKEDDSEKIANNVRTFRVSDNGKKIFYINTEGSLYLQVDDKDREKIDREVRALMFVTEDFDTIYYRKEDSIYKKVKNKDEEKIVSDVSGVIEIYDSGELYFTKTEYVEYKLSDYLIDDMKDSDAAMKEPDEPYVWDYYDSDEWSAAYKKYEAEYEKYKEKLRRDDLRKLLDGRTAERSVSKLFYYNGKEEVLVSEGFVKCSGVASESQVIVYRACTQTEFEKVKLSQISSVYNIEQEMEDLMYLSPSKWYIAVESKSTLVEQEGVDKFYINNDGSVIYMQTGYNEGRDGELYRVNINKGKIGKAELYDTEVSFFVCGFVYDDHLMYFKEYYPADNKGDLYINKKKIASEVYTRSIFYVEEGEKVVYISDWDQEKKYGTLYVYENGKNKKVSEEVTEFDFTSNGDVLYLYDYSYKYGTGDLYVYKNGKKNKIDKDVAAIVSTYYKTHSSMDEYYWYY